MSRESRRELLAAARVTGSVWAAYDYVDAHGLCGFQKPLPGWRVDRLLDDGRIAGYGTDGTTIARCGAPKAGTLFSSQPAVAHDLRCPCGYRICRDVYTLLQYVYLAPATDIHRPSGTLYNDDEGYIQVLTRVLGDRDAAPARTVDRSDPPGTIRVSRTRLVEVWVPSRQRDRSVDSRRLAAAIRRRYPDVTVHCLPGDLDSFPGTPDTAPPEVWPIIPEGGYRFQVGGRWVEMRWMTRDEFEELIPGICEELGRGTSGAVRIYDRLSALYREQHEAGGDES